MHTKLKLVAALCLLMLGLSSVAQINLNSSGYYDGEGITFDPQTDKYTVKYLDYDGVTGNFVILQYEAPNKVKPALKMQVRSSFSRDIIYSFDVGNGRQAKQAIYAFSAHMLVPWFENTSLVTHSVASAHASAGNIGSATQAIEASLTYTGSIEDNRMKQPAKWLPEIKFSKTNKAYAMSWQAHPNKFPLDDIRPGQHRVGFGIVAPYLPGLVKFNFMGDSPALKFPGGAGGDSKIWKDIDQLLFRNKAPVQRIATLGPKVLIPEPYNNKLMALAIADDLASWVAAGQLSEPLAQRLRLTLAAIGESAERNNEAGVEGNIKQIFGEIFGRHKGMDHTEFDEDREEKRADQPELSYLAARAIGFNAFELLKRYTYYAKSAKK
jgi:hypothetical protein